MVCVCVCVCAVARSMAPLAAEPLAEQAVSE